MKTESLTITAPDIRAAEFKIRGNSPLVQHKFSEKTQREMQEQQEAGETAKKNKKRSKKDFEDCFKRATYITPQKWYGIPAPAFRAAAISACRVCGFQMTKAKLSIFCLADGYDGSTPLVKITKGKPRMDISPVRLANGSVDLRARPMWDPGWEATVRLEFDAEQFTLEDVANLMMRVGRQVGLCEGRPDSKKSAGMGWGTFELVGPATEEGKAKRGRGKKAAPKK